MTDEIIKLIEYALGNPFFQTIGIISIAMFVLVFVIAIVVFFVIMERIFSINKHFRSDWRWHR